MSEHVLMHQVQVPVVDRDAKRAVWRSMGWDPQGVKLNLASGADYRPGWTNVDTHALFADLRWDLFKFPWPFPDAHADAVLLDNYIEHIPHRVADKDALMATFEELYRVLKPGGTAYIAVPYANTANDLHNPLHYRSFLPSTLAFLWDTQENEPTRTETSSRFTLLKMRIRRKFGFYRFNNLYHLPKHLHINFDRVGKKWEIVWVLQKPMGTN